MTRLLMTKMAARVWVAALFLGMVLGPGGGPARAADGDLSTRKGQAEAALAALGYGIAPSPYSSLLFVEQTEQGNSNFRNGQFGGRIPLDRDPLYLEGYFAFQRYAPVVGVPATGEDVTVQWRSYSGTGGIGWNFDLGENWDLRPIFNLGIGRVTSNSDFSEEEDGITDFLSEDPMNAGAIGASMLFAYSAMQGEQETDIRIRHSRMELFPVGDWSDTGASALAVTTAGLARLRHPIPQLGQVRNGPVRAVYEGSLAVYSGDQDDVFDIPWLGRAGVGLEIETGLTRPDRARVMVRYVFGDDFNAVAIGGALQF